MYTSPGTYSETTPAGMNRCTLQAWGAGGSGGSSKGGGGGGHSYSIVAVNPGDIVQITVGKGGEINPGKGPANGSASTACVQGSGSMSVAAEGGLGGDAGGTGGIGHYGSINHTGGAGSSEGYGGGCANVVVNGGDAGRTYGGNFGGSAPGVQGVNAGGGGGSAALGGDGQVKVDFWHE